MPSHITFTPTGFVHSPIREPLDDVWGEVISRIELDSSRFAPDCLKGLDEFSHVEIVFTFHRIPDSEIYFGARRPRGRADWPEVAFSLSGGRTGLIGLGSRFAACSRSTT
jgi:tRNA (adenine37-N6)-methyltransferase